MALAAVDGQRVVADFDGGAITSNAGALLLGATDRAIGLIERFARCFVDSRAGDRVVHDLSTLVGQRVLGIALGYEDLVDHDELRHDSIKRNLNSAWWSSADFSLQALDLIEAVFRSGFACGAN
jgi:hypothetical protein